MEKENKVTFACRICGKEFEDLYECIEHEAACMKEYKKKQEECLRQKKEAEKKEKIEKLKTDLKIASDFSLKKYNEYVDALNAQTKIEEELDKLQDTMNFFNPFSYFDF